MNTVRLILLGVLVKLAGVTLAGSNGRYVRGINVFPQKSVPCDLCKPRMVLDILGSSMKIAQALCQVWCDQLRQQVDRIWVHVRREFDLSAKNVFVDLDGRTAVPERSEAAEHFKYKNSQGPPRYSQGQRCCPLGLFPRSLPVYRFVVPLGRDDLWSKIVWCTAERPCDVRHILCETEIGNLQVTMPIQQQVLRFEITVNDVLCMQVLQG
jgi:hypothetical protein